MNNDKEKLKLICSLIIKFYSTISRDIEDGIVLLIASKIITHEIDDIKKNLNQLVLGETRYLTPNKIISTIAPEYALMEADQAWALFPKSENDTGIISINSLKAWDCAKDIYENNGDIPARVAFIKSYNSFSGRNMDDHKTTVSIGTDKNKVDMQLIKAGNLSLISGSKAASLAVNRDEVILSLIANNKITPIAAMNYAVDVKLIKDNLMLSLTKIPESQRLLYKEQINKAQLLTDKTASAENEIYINSFPKDRRETVRHDINENKKMSKDEAVAKIKKLLVSIPDKKNCSQNKQEVSEFYYLVCDKCQSISSSKEYFEKYICVKCEKK